MEKIKKIGTTIYNHKKKFIFATLVTAYGIDYARLTIRDANIRTFYAKQALKYGEEKISPEYTPRRLTVLVNKSANTGTGITDFKKNALPLLHLAGIAVNIINVDNAEQMKDLCKVLDKQEADGIMIIGGDGTINDALIGLVEKNDENNLPVGIFPGGRCNKSLRLLVPLVFGERNDVRYQCESAMAVIEESVKKIKPIKIEITSEVGLNDEKKSEDNDENKTEKDVVKTQLKKETLYTIGDIANGWFNYIDDRKWKFWYWGSLKRRFAYFWEMLKHSPYEVKVEVTMTDYCSGCNKCRTTKIAPKPEWRWWHFLTGPPKVPKLVNEKNYSQIVNEGCGQETSICTQGTDFVIIGEQHEDSCSLRLRVGGRFANRWNIMRDGWTRTSEDYIVSSAVQGFYYTDLIGSSIFVKFLECPDLLKKIFIGGENKDVEPEKTTIKINPIEKSIYLYLPKHTRVSLDAV